MAPTSAFFEDFPDFAHDPAAPSLEREFRRLAIHRGWAQGSKTWKQQHGRCLVAAFKANFEEGSTKLQRWQALCREVGLGSTVTEGVGGGGGGSGLESITACKKALKNVHVNLVDLIDSRRTETQVHRFPSKAALQAYTRADKRRVFPKAAAKKDGFLRALLRDIF
ncbi:MAG: hypothetical protein M1837_003758 [Sclerophora amabilis]|nr:MAG: hypothetical protein M1837_003758 [Sclerophora amabilis]